MKDLNNLTPDEFNNLAPEELAKLTPDQVLRYKEAQSGMVFDKDTAQPLNLGRAENFLARQGTDKIPGGESGWKPVPIGNLPSQGRFYPEGTTIEIRPALVGEVRHFSTIDETDPLDVDDKLNLVVEKCLKITFPDRTAHYKDLKEEDRFYMIFAIRELTFMHGENKLYVNLKCGSKCLGDGTYEEKIELRKDNFDWYKIDAKLMRYYDVNERCFIINSPKLGTFKLYVPSVGIATFLKGYIRDKVQKGGFYDKAFLKVAPFLFGDWRTLNETVYTKAQQDSFGWSQEKLGAVLQLVEMIRFGVKTQITKQCNKCGAEVATPLTFPGGVRSLFIRTDSLEELLG